MYAGPRRLGRAGKLQSNVPDQDSHERAGIHLEVEN